MFEAYDAISQFCLDHSKPIAVRNHAYCLYLETVKEVSDGVSNEVDMDRALQALFTEQAIQGYVSRAETFTEGVVQSALEPILQEQRRSSFWSGVWSGVLGNFIFSLLLVVIFYIGKGQLESWLSAVTG